MQLPKKTFATLAFIISSSVFNSAVSASFTQCPTEAFLSQYNAGATHYKSVNLATGKVTTLQTDDILGSDVVNAIAFNEADQYVYGFNKQKLALVRFDHNFKGSVLNFTNPPANNFYVGDIYNNTYYMYRKDIGFFKTNLDPAAADYLTINKINGATQNINIADFAFHPTNGHIYAVESSSGNLYKINPTSGIATLVTYSGVKASGSHFGAAYFDKKGFLYVVRNSDGNIYRIDITDPSNVTDNAVYFSKAAPTNSNDGARCAQAAVAADFTDFGDAPDSYKTTLADNGARHSVNNNNFYLGSAVDADDLVAIALHNDDANNIDDEDGVQFQTSLTTGLDAQISVTIGGEASTYVNAWFDWNGNGQFDESTEHVITGSFLAKGQHNIVISVPEDAVAGQTWVRFRASSVATLLSYGGGGEGEVEDYQVTISAASISYLHYPSENQFVTLAYEDKWPEVGDYDFNDVAMLYRVTQVIQYDTNTNKNQVVRFDITGKLLAYGASYSNGFAIQIPGILRSNIDESLIKLTYNGETQQAAAPLEAGQDNAVIVISDNLKNNFTSNCPFSYYKTQPGCNENDNFIFSVNVPLKTPIELDSVPSMPLDPFIFGSENRSRNDFFGGVMPGRSIEVHLADKPVTKLGSTDYFTQYDDASDSLSQIFYRTALKLPWAIEIGGEWQVPLEQVDITVAYPYFRNFIATNGNEDQDWFTKPILHKVY